jgi:hypothetical protein
MKRQSLPILAIASLLLGFGLEVTIARADCLASTRDVTFPDGSTQIRTYVCRLNVTGGPALQVEFDRLSETAAGNLVENTPYPDLTQVFGSPEVLHNAVFSDVKSLFDTYGIREIAGTCYLFSVAGEGTAHTGRGRTNPSMTLGNYSTSHHDSDEWPNHGRCRRNL